MPELRKTYTVNYETCDDTKDIYDVSYFTDKEEALEFSRNLLRNIPNRAIIIMENTEEANTAVEFGWERIDQEHLMINTAEDYKLILGI